MLVQQIQRLPQLELKRIRQIVLYDKQQATYGFKLNWTPCSSAMGKGGESGEGSGEGTAGKGREKGGEKGGIERGGERMRGRRKGWDRRVEGGKSEGGGVRNCWVRMKSRGSVTSVTQMKSELKYKQSKLDFTLTKSTLSFTVLNQPIFFTCMDGISIATFMILSSTSTYKESFTLHNGERMQNNKTMQAWYSFKMCSLVVDKRIALWNHRLWWRIQLWRH